MLDIWSIKEMYISQNVEGLYHILKTHLLGSIWKRNRSVFTIHAISLFKNDILGRSSKTFCNSTGTERYNLVQFINDFQALNSLNIFPIQKTQYNLESIIWL